jgi:glycosyltransferase involved in cell wall biosynthesis
MKVSLIISTRNRAERLSGILASLAALEDPPGGWELILVDNASTDATPTVLEQFARQAAFPVRVVRASIPGVSRGRNAGLAHARGDIIAFTDDDCHPRPDYLRAVVEVFEESRRSNSDGARGLGFVGGRIVLHNPDDARVCARESLLSRQAHSRRQYGLQARGRVRDRRIRPVVRPGKGDDLM